MSAAMAVNEERQVNHLLIHPEEQLHTEVNNQSQAVLEVHDLSISFTQYTSGLHQQELQVISDLHIDIMPGEILAVLGASGSGKSLLAHAILGILPGNARTSGRIAFEGEELTPAKQASLRGKRIALVPQSVTYLDPLMRVGRQVRLAVRDGDPVKVQREVFKRYHLDRRVEKLFPYQLSGGMARRILVAMALVSGAGLIIADEPTPGLDQAVLNEALGHFRELADEGRSIMLITHDIDTALRIADRIAIFYAGTTVEIAPAADFCNAGERLRHPYSKALWRALPQNDFEPLAGSQPLPNCLPSGCLFHPRCPAASSACTSSQPAARTLRGGMVRCFHAT